MVIFFSELKSLISIVCFPDFNALIWRCIANADNVSQHWNYLLFHVEHSFFQIIDKKHVLPYQYYYSDPYHLYPK